MDEVDGQEGEEENKDNVERRRRASLRRISGQWRTMASDGEKIGGAMESSGDTVRLSLWL